MSDPAIETIGLTKRYKSRKQAKTLRQRLFGGSQTITAVDHVDLKVRTNESKIGNDRNQVSNNPPQLSS